MAARLDTRWADIRRNSVDWLLSSQSRLPVIVAGTGAALIWLLVLVLLTGVIGGAPGKVGAIAVPDGVENGPAYTDTAVGPLAAALRSDSNNALDNLHPAKTGPERKWLDRYVCGPFAPAQGTRAQREALAFRMSSSNADLCTGLNGLAARAPMAVSLGYPLAFILIMLILGGLGYLGIRSVRSLRGVREAYRRLYGSEHLNDHMEDPA